MEVNINDHCRNFSRDHAVKPTDHLLSCKAMLECQLSETFAAGTLVLPFCAASPHDHGHWVPLADYPFDWYTLSFRCSDSHLLETVDYLVRTDFIYATITSAPSSSTYVRIYLVPADTASGQTAWLRTAKPAVLNARTEHLRFILSCLNTSREAWEGRASPTALPRSFFESCEFTTQTGHAQTLSHIFQSLPSPTIDESRLNDTSRPMIEDFVQYDGVNDNIPGLRSSLYPYQGKYRFRI